MLLHLFLLSKMGAEQSSFNLGFAPTLTLFAWFVSLIALLMSLRVALPALFIILFPFNIITIVCALLLPSDPISTSPMLSSALLWHIASSLLAYGILSIASLIAILLAIQDFQLHHHRQSTFLKELPALQTLESLLFRLIEAGFILLTLSVITGFISTNDLFNHKIVFSSIAWVVFLVLLVGRHLAGWRGQTAIRWTLLGIVALMLAIFGTKVALEFIVSP